jgi:hypothetical protein
MVVIKVEGGLPMPQLDETQVVAELYWWLSMHPQRCPVDVETAFLIAWDVINNIMNLADNACENTKNPKAVFREGFSEQIELMLLRGYTPEQIKWAMGRLMVEP